MQMRRDATRVAHRRRRRRCRRLPVPTDAATACPRLVQAVAAIREEAARVRPQSLAKLMDKACVSRCPCGPCILDSATAAAAAEAGGRLRLSLQEIA